MAPGGQHLHQTHAVHVEVVALVVVGHGVGLDEGGHERAGHTGPLQLLECLGELARLHRLVAGEGALQTRL
ncbi:MAG: hypothetical protein ABSE98_09690 [Acidimicrobiales bacterium]